LTIKRPKRQERSAAILAAIGRGRDARSPSQKALESFVRIDGAKHPKAARCLKKDREALLAFYDFPAEH